MANDIEWGQGTKNNAIGWGQGAANNSISWGLSHFDSPSGETEIYGIRQDANVTAFLTATGITDTTITSALEELVLDLKSYSIWDKMKAIYPFVGGTATTHKFNLVNPADTNGAFRLTFNGGITHSSNGVQGNGVNGFANTNLNILSNLSLTDTHLSFYSRTNLINNGFGNDIASDGSYIPTSSCSLRVRNASQGGTQYFTIGTDNGASISNTNGLGLTLGTTNSLTSRKLFQNGVLKVTQTASNTGTLRNNNVVLLGGDATFSFNQCAFASIGNNLTDEDSANLYYSVQKFQTTLGRQVGTPIGDLATEDNNKIITEDNNQIITE